MDRKFLFALLAAAIILISGCTTPYDGSPPKVGQSRIDAVTAAATAWLASEDGKEMFPAGSLAAPVPVFTINRTFEHWVLPVKDENGMYIGFFVTKKDNFTVPELGVTKYSYARHNLFSKSKDEAYNAILAGTIYSADQVKEPYVTTIEGRGYHWTCEIVADGKFITKKNVAISTIEPSNADRTAGST